MADKVVNDTRNIDPSVGGTLFERYFTGRHTAEEIADKTYFLTADYVGVIAMETSDGLLLVDTGMSSTADRVHDELRKHTTAPLHTVVYTHGHMDHAFGLKPWIDAGESPRIIAQERVVERFETYKRTGPLNIHANKVQFGIEEGIVWPQEHDDFIWPTVTYRDELTIEVGGETFELHHAKGETDDATWVFAPERGIVCTGDLWIGMLPNCGNPQKVQRYPEEWADALEAIASKGPRLLLPGHGPIVEGAEQIKKLCLDTAEALRALVEQTLEGLNAGRPHDEIVASVHVPDHLITEPYLDPLYDRPEFIARNVIRKYGGWWSGHPADLLPASREAQAREIVALAGGVDPVVDRALAVNESDPELAGHLAEWAFLAEPGSTRACQCVIDIFGKRAESEISLMGRGILSHAVRRAEKSLAAKGESEA
ncbi:MAG: alkyl sulfatase dimerization domain-containing protein [Myxococcota bacterium]|jgi:glyoxylase-like metal-dependent hydrolase (beta-lactamase superfamily II)|nr:alkyl sulfatase dimerization domain-containing protein [Myxococcota bacterium]